LPAKHSKTTGNCNTSSSTLLNKSGVSKQQINEMKNQIDGKPYGFGDIKPWTKSEKEDALRKEHENQQNERNEILDKIDSFANYLGLW